MKLNIICWQLLLLLCLAPALALGQQPLSGSETQGGMTFDWKVVGELLTCTITAPTDGWIALGFNEKNSILGADLLMARVKNGVAEARDQYVTGPRQNKDDGSLGGVNHLMEFSGSETGKRTTFSWTIPLNSGDQFDKDLSRPEGVWVILAYSVSDDWDHHSIMRQHVKVKFVR